jgi:hypothetical protein
MIEQAPKIKSLDRRVMIASFIQSRKKVEEVFRVVEKLQVSEDLKEAIPEMFEALKAVCFEVNFKTEGDPIHHQHDGLLNQMFDSRPDIKVFDDNHDWYVHYLWTCLCEIQAITSSLILREMVGAINLSDQTKSVVHELGRKNVRCMTLTISEFV